MEKPFKFFSLDAKKSIDLPEEAYTMLSEVAPSPGISILRSPAPMCLFLKDGVMVIAAGTHEDDEETYVCINTISAGSIPYDLEEWWAMYRDEVHTLADARLWVNKMTDVFAMAFISAMDQAE